MFPFLYHAVAETSRRYVQSLMCIHTPNDENAVPTLYRPLRRGINPDPTLRCTKKEREKGTYLERCSRHDAPKTKAGVLPAPPTKKKVQYKSCVCITSSQVHTRNLHPHQVPTLPPILLPQRSSAAVTGASRLVIATGSHTRIVGSTRSITAFCSVSAARVLVLLSDPPKRIMETPREIVYFSSQRHLIVHVVFPGRPPSRCRCGTDCPQPRPNSASSSSRRRSSLAGIRGRIMSGRVITRPYRRMDGFTTGMAGIQVTRA